MLHRPIRLAYLFLYLSATSVTGCITEQVMQDPASGGIVGYVYLRDEDGDRTARHDSVVVELVATNHRAVTDSSGRWEITGVPAGIYDLRYSREGYSPTLTRAFQFVGGGTAYITATIELNVDTRDTFIVRQSRFAPYISITPILDSIADTGFVWRYDTSIVPNQVLEIIGDMVFENPSHRERILYFQPNFQASTLNIQVGTIRQGHDTARIKISQLESQGFARGKEHRLVLSTRQMNTTYYEPSTRQRIYYDTHNAAVLNVTLPE